MRQPRPVLYGPDSRYGAKKKRSLKTYRWYIVWHDEAGSKREKATGLERHQDPTEAVATFIANQGTLVTQPRQGVEYVTEALTVYGHEKAPHTKREDVFHSCLPFLVEYFLDARVEDLNEAIFRDYAKQRAEGLVRPEGPQYTDRDNWTVSTNTVRRDLEMLRSALNWCHTHQRLETVPRVWLPDKPPPRDRYLERSEIAALLKAARANKRSTNFLPIFILISIYTGNRSRAVLDLQWKPNDTGGYIDLDAGIIDFRKRKEAQTRKRRSVVPIPKKLQTILRGVSRRTNTHVIEYNGQPIKKLRRSFSTATEAAGLDDVTAHTLNHTAVTLMLQAGVREQDVSWWTGKSLEVIRKVYGHHSPEYLKDAREIIDRGLGVRKGPDNE